MKLRILIAGLMFGIAALADDSGAELFQKAVTQEQAAGNLEEAIKLYQRVAKEFASDRPLAAKALVQEARCYEKLGQDKAVKLYEQVAHDFGDQRELAATASARLAVLKRSAHPAPAVPATITQRRIEVGIPNIMLFTEDEHRGVYLDLATDALMMGDLMGREKRVIFKPSAGLMVAFEPSRDFSMVLVGVMLPGHARETFGVIKADGTGYREIRGDSSCRSDWSWDNRYIFLCEGQPNGRSQLLRVSVADRETRSLGENHGIQNRPSPDGRFIAYLAAPSQLTPAQIFVMPSQGGEPHLVSENARLMDWTADGRYLIIVAQRSGSEALYLVPMKDGRQSGEPVFVRYGSFGMGRMRPNGALIHGSMRPEGTPVWFGTFDSNGRSGGWKRLSLSGSLQNLTWSPDSSEIAYAASDLATGQSTQVIRLRSVATGEERELYRGSAKFDYCWWAVQQPNLFCEHLTPQLTEVQSVSIESGAVEQLGSISGEWYLVGRCRDDRAIYIYSDSRHELVRWEIGTQRTTTLYQSANCAGVSVSPDERSIARLEKGEVAIRPLSGGDWKPLFSASSTQFPLAFTPDGNWFLYSTVDAAGKRSLFRVASTGGQPERIGDFPAVTVGSLNISSDGKKMIVAGHVDWETWILENFEPKQQASH
jgi:Tol biopolymer transport system component